MSNCYNISLLKASEESRKVSCIFRRFRGPWCRGAGGAQRGREPEGRRAAPRCAERGDAGHPTGDPDRLRSSAEGGVLAAGEGKGTSRDRIREFWEVVHSGGSPRLHVSISGILRGGSLASKLLGVSDLACALPSCWQVLARLGAPEELLAVLRKSPRVQFLAQHVPKVRPECSRGAQAVRLVSRWPTWRAS